MQNIFVLWNFDHIPFCTFLPKKFLQKYQSITVKQNQVKKLSRNWDEFRQKKSSVFFVYNTVNTFESHGIFIDAKNSYVICGKKSGLLP